MFYRWKVNLINSVWEFEKKKNENSKPVNLLWSRTKSVNFPPGVLQKLSGNVPVSELASSWIPKYGALPNMSLGIVPEKWFSPIWTLFNRVNIPVREEEQAWGGERKWAQHLRREEKKEKKTNSYPNQGGSIQTIPYFETQFGLSIRDWNRKWGMFQSPFRYGREQDRTNEWDWKATLGEFQTYFVSHGQAHRQYCHHYVKKRVREVKDKVWKRTESRARERARERDNQPCTTDADPIVITRISI